MDSGWGVEETGQLTTLIGTIRDALSRIATIDLTRVLENDLLSATQELERTLRSGQIPQLALTREIHARDLGDLRGHRNTAGLLTDLLTISRGDAAGRVQAATMVLPREAQYGDPDADQRGYLPPQLPVVAEAVTAGEVGADQLRIITRALHAIPAEVDQATRDLCEKTLVDAAHYRPAPKLAEVARQIGCITNPDGSDRDLDKADKVELTIGQRHSDGLTPIRGLLDDLGVEYLRQAIEPLAAPRPAEDGTPDPRSAGVRRGQALAELCGRWLDTASGGRTVRGVRPHAVITATLDQLRDGVGAALLGYAGPAGHAITRLLTCNADTTLIATDQNGRVLDGTGEFRLFTAAQHTALGVRDGHGCAFPGCDIPQPWTDTHHIQHWADGGTTVLDNGVLLCRYHHGVIHRKDSWTVRYNPADGHPWFVPPAWLDPHQKPRRNRTLEPPTIDHRTNPARRT